MSLCVTASLLLGLVGCFGNTQSGGEEYHKTVIFTDDSGREVEVPAEITRIAAAGPVAQILLFAIAPEKLVGLAAQWNNSAQGIIPVEYFDLPYFGQLYNTANLNVEELAYADPQVIIDIGLSMASGAEDLSTIQDQTGIPTVFISSDLKSIPDAFRKLGNLLGKQERGEALAEFCERVYNRTLSIMEQVGENKVDALYVLGEKGLNVLAKNSYHSELLDLLTNNVAVVDNPISKGSGNEVTMEQIALWDPDFVLFASDSIFDSVSEHDTWSSITAIHNEDYVEVPVSPYDWLGSPPASQRYLGMIWLTAELYPDYCDYDTKAEIMQYYRLFYGCDLSETQYEQLTENAFRN